MRTVSRLCLLSVVLAWTPDLLIEARAAETGSASDDLLIVDCLLPGQIRHLGIRSTYVSARQPVRTSARDCRIRGGEYASYDRADYQTSLSVWLPAARQGDNEARVNVGTIFERGLGRAPDYAAAAQWYTLAAERGHIEAQLKLAHLLETGLGVPRDPDKAFYWYRQAMGLDDAELDLAPSRSNRVPERALGALEAELRSLQQDNRELRGLLEETHARSQENPQRLPRLQAQLGALETALAQRTQELQTLEDRYQAARERYATAASEGAAAEARLDHLRRRGETKSDDNLASRELAAATIDQLQGRLQHKEAQLRDQQARLGELRERLGELELNLQTVAAQHEATRQAAADRRLSGPSVTMIDPRLPSTRGLVQVTVPDSGRQQLVGRVEAPAGLLTLTVNETPLETNASGVFLTELPVRGAMMVSVKAIDSQGKRADLSFELRTGPSGIDSLPSAVAEPGLDLGRFHALVIGNDNYRHLPKLKTAIHDAEAIAAVLKDHYSFDARLLINADRYTILSALNDYRERLTSEDNLLIYYAGHGELDEVNMRGHWLPVDAEAQSTANWISNVAVTDVLNVMGARHVMLIVDSCYSGSLTRSSVASLGASRTDAEQQNWIRTMSRKRARLVLSSGGLAPVLDAGGGRHSVFANALLDVLGNNNRLLDGRELYQEVAARVAYAASNVQFEQVPEFGPIRHAGHEAGAFFLVPSRSP